MHFSVAPFPRLTLRLKRSKGLHVTRIKSLYSRIQSTCVLSTSVHTVCGCWAPISDFFPAFLPKEVPHIPPLFPVQSASAYCKTLPVLRIESSPSLMLGRLRARRHSSNSVRAIDLLQALELRDSAMMKLLNLNSSSPTSRSARLSVTFSMSSPHERLLRSVHQKLRPTHVENPYFVQSETHQVNPVILPGSRRPQICLQAERRLLRRRSPDHGLLLHGPVPRAQGRPPGRTHRALLGNVQVQLGPRIRVGGQLPSRSLGVLPLLHGDPQVTGAYL